MGVHALGCTIQSNMGSDVRVCNEEKGAKFELYAKARLSSDTKLTGRITRGFSDTRYKPKMHKGKDLPARFLKFPKEPQSNLRASFQMKNNDQ